MIFNKKSSILIFILFLFMLLPSIAFAHGNPVFLYSLIGFAVFHLILAIYLLFLRKIGGLRFVLCGLYFICLFFCWLWALNYIGPNFSGMYVGLLVGPLLNFILILLLMKQFRKFGVNR